MNYDNSLGIIGNINRLYKELVLLKSSIFTAEQNGIVGRIEMEQSLTDLYLDGVQAQQDITDLQIQILEG